MLVFAQIDMTVGARDPCRPCLSTTDFTARSRNLGESLFTVSLIILFYTQVLQSLKKPVRFKAPGGRPLAAVCSLQIEVTQPDQQEQRRS